MDYQSPKPADLANVIALNRAFLDWLRNHRREMWPGGHLTIGERLAGLDPIELARLARAPFLLLSLREHDEGRWRTLFLPSRNMDLLCRLQRPDEQAATLVAAALGFLWELARRNPYGARLVSGAGLNWCEQLAEQTLMALITRVTDEDSLLEPRMADNADLWNKLLTAAVSERRDVRVAARLTALQTVLLCGPVTGYRQLAAAACRMPAVTTRAADRRRR